MVYVENPLTGHAIKKNGPTAKKLMALGYDMDSLPKVRKGYRSPSARSRSPGYARRTDMPRMDRRSLGEMYEEHLSLSPGRIRPPGAAIRTGRRVNRRMGRRDTSQSPRRVARRSTRRSMSPNHSWSTMSPMRQSLQNARQRSLKKREPRTFT